MSTGIEHYTAAAEGNKKRVYGVLTNLIRFAFYSYNLKSNTFCEDDEIFVGALRDCFSSHMLYGMCLVS